MPKRWNLAEKWSTSYKILLVYLFPVKKLHKFVWIWILAKNKMITESKLFEKMSFRRPKNGIWLKNDESFTESCSLTHFQLKSYTHLFESKFWCKIKWASEQKFSKKCSFGGWNDGIWPKNDEPLPESYLLTHFQSKSCTNFGEIEFWHKKNEHRNKNL